MPTFSIALDGAECVNDEELMLLLSLKLNEAGSDVVRIKKYGKHLRKIGFTRKKLLDDGRVVVELTPLGDRYIAANAKRISDTIYRKLALPSF